MNKIKHFFEQSWLLIVTAFCFGLLIATTNAALSQRIKQNEKDKLYSLMGGLITDARNFVKAIEKAEITGAKGKVTKTDIYKALDDSNNCAGFAFVAVGPGFADKIKLVIAVDETFEKFFGFKVLSSNETPGFGSKITEDYFGSQFKNAPATNLELTKTGNTDVIDARIVAISGATVSSEAVVKIFNAYILKIKEQLKGKELIRNGS
ncbi:MAG: FMN-binding protein [Planctomycetota bacterium]|jgi:electron transport complex protein RnfG